MVDFARTLPRLRERVDAELAAATSSTPTACCACAVRLLDRGFFRIGGEDYAVRNESYGLATMKKSHVQHARRRAASSTTRPSRASAACRPSSTRWSPTSCATLKRRRGGGDELLAYKRGRRWADVRSEDINAYLKEATGEDVSAKDFRTWGATVLAAVALAVSERGGRDEDRPQARDHARRQGGRLLPRQHAGRRAGLLHRPARLRPLPRRRSDRLRLVAARRAHGDATAIQGPLEEAVLKLLEG